VAGRYKVEETSLVNKFGAHWVHIGSTGSIDFRIGKLRIYKLEID
jgi:hypothetical protein